MFEKASDMKSVQKDVSERRKTRLKNTQQKETAFQKSSDQARKDFQAELAAERKAFHDSYAK
jgi:hypothetical protein